MQIHDKVFVGGRWRHARGSSRTLIAAATELPHASVRDCTCDDVDEAAESALAAARDWAAVGPNERAALVAAIGERLREHAEDLARGFAVEVGTPLVESRRLQVGLALRAFAHAPQLAWHLDREEELGQTSVRRVPVGVAACITPWNYPLYQVATKIVPAMVAGAPVVLKPSELAPLSTFVLAQCAQQAGLPAGVFNVVLGGADIGQRLLQHPAIAVVSFTGSTATGRQIGALAGGALKKVALELGGKSAAVVLPDADLGQAVKQTIAKCYQNAGQTCAALTRLLVARSQLDRVCALAATEASGYLLGDPMDPATRLGPVFSQRHRDRVQDMIRSAIEEGAQVISGGAEPPAEHPRGYYIRPTVLLVNEPAAQIVQQEVFGPVLVVQAYDTEEEAIALANGTPFGLSAAVWAADRARALVVARRLHCGSVSINGATTHPEAPFGGFGASGFGRERGRYGLDTYSTTQALHQ